MFLYVFWGSSYLDVIYWSVGWIENSCFCNDVYWIDGGDGNEMDEISYE